MAKNTVLGIGACLKPLLTLQSQHWLPRAIADYVDDALNLSDGRLFSYDELLREVGPMYESVAAAEHLGDWRFAADGLSIGSCRNCGTEHGLVIRDLPLHWRKYLPSFELLPKRVAASLLLYRKDRIDRSSETYQLETT